MSDYITDYIITEVIDSILTQSEGNATIFKTEKNGEAPKDEVVADNQIIISDSNHINKGYDHPEQLTVESAPVLMDKPIANGYRAGYALKSQSNKLCTVMTEVIDSILTKIEENEKNKKVFKIEKNGEDPKGEVIENNQIIIFGSNHMNKGYDHAAQLTVESAPVLMDKSMADGNPAGYALKSQSNKLCMFNSNLETLRPTSAPPLKMLNSFSLLFRIRPVKSDLLMAEEIRWSYKTKRETSMWLNNPILKFDSYIYDEERFTQELNFSKTDKPVAVKQLECFEFPSSLSLERKETFTKKKENFVNRIMIPSFINRENNVFSKGSEIDKKLNKYQNYENGSIMSQFKQNSSISCLSLIQDQIELVCGDMNGLDSLDKEKHNCKRTTDKSKFEKNYFEKTRADNHKDFGDFDSCRLVAEGKSMTDGIHLANVNNFHTHATLDSGNSLRSTLTPFGEAVIVEKTLSDELDAVEQVISDNNNHHDPLFKTGDYVENSEKNVYSNFKDNESSNSEGMAEDGLPIFGDSLVGGEHGADITPSTEIDSEVSQHVKVHRKVSAVEEELYSNCSNVTKELVAFKDVCTDTVCVSESDSLDSVEIPIFSGSSEYQSTESWMEDDSWPGTSNNSSFNSEKTYVLQDLKNEEKVCRPVIKPKSVLEKIKVRSNRVSPSGFIPIVKNKSKFRQFLSDVNKRIRCQFKTLRKSCKSKKNCKPKVFLSVPLFFWCM